MEHMRTATVRDLRNQYLNLLRWLRAGEAVAKLVPMPAETPAGVEWAESAAVRRDRTTSRPLSAAESSEIVHDASGPW
jgi:antitoxin (DNA-binding transcriptional repressor) of toxin-antitoxin stability system